MRSHTETEVLSLPTCDWPGCERIAGYDAKTTAGPWMFACDFHFRTECYGLGLGLGQRLRVVTGS